MIDLGKNLRHCRYPVMLLSLIHIFHFSEAQCPPNLDFESGNFINWTCYTGHTAAVGADNTINITPSGPVPERHTMYSANSGMVDPYGGFSVNCPNGSGHSIRLGNDQGGGEAEGISYQFNIPPGQDVYSLIYHYAVVFQDPTHEIFQQPRMVVEIMNLTDNVLIDCSSFTFIPFGNILPGFYLSPLAGDDGTPVWCKDWSAVTINLNGHAGKTIRLLFKTADCTFRRHFGYAYIDVNTECSDEFVGATYCPGDSSVTITAPYGYQNYTWFNNNFTQPIGGQQNIVFTPPPPSGTTIAVEVTPYSGYGCLDTLYARLIDTLTIRANAGLDTLYCGSFPVLIGSNAKPGLVYNWSPAAGLNDPYAANPSASPDITTNYVLTVRSGGGGCMDTDTVRVRSASLIDSILLIGKAAYCIDNNDSSILRVSPADSIQWYRDGIAIHNANDFQFRVNQSGSYHARLFSDLGCKVNTKPEVIFIDKPALGINYPVEYAIIDMPYGLSARQIGSSCVWDPGIFLNNVNTYTPVFNGSSDRMYTIRLTTNSGCVTVDTQMVKTVKSAEIYVPTAFSPNEDGLNDILRPTLMGIKDLHFFRVFNRWGQLIYETKSSRIGWNGRIRGVPQITQTVVWIAQGVGVDGKIHTRKGTSILIR
jgi:gliding motility-associated-like protein